MIGVEQWDANLQDAIVVFYNENGRTNVSGAVIGLGWMMDLRGAQDALLGATGNIICHQCIATQVIPIFYHTKILKLQYRWLKFTDATKTGGPSKYVCEINIWTDLANAWYGDRSQTKLVRLQCTRQADQGGI